MSSPDGPFRGPGDLLADLVHEFGRTFGRWLTWGAKYVAALAAVAGVAMAPVWGFSPLQKLREAEEQLAAVRERLVAEDIYERMVYWHNRALGRLDQADDQRFFEELRDGAERARLGADSALNALPFQRCDSTSQGDERPSEIQQRLIGPLCENREHISQQVSLMERIIELGPVEAQGSVEADEYERLEGLVDGNVTLVLALIDSIRSSGAD